VTLSGNCRSTLVQFQWVWRVDESADGCAWAPLSEHRTERAALRMAKRWARVQRRATRVVREELVRGGVFDGRGVS